MEILDQHSINPCTVTNQLIRRTLVDDGNNSYGMGEWHIPLTGFGGHLYAPYPVSVLIRFTKQQVPKLHRQFFHPSSFKLYNLLKKSRPEDTTSETQKQLEEIRGSCDPCQRIRASPMKFKVSLGTENIPFNEEFIIDFM